MNEGGAALWSRFFYVKSSTEYLAYIGSMLAVGSFAF